MSIINRPLPREDSSGTLRDFLSVSSSNICIDLCLPVFESGGGTLLKGSVSADTFRYPSETLATRDVRSAFYIQRLLSQEFTNDRFRLLSPNEFVRSYEIENGDRIGFMFGSRSNEALKETAVRTRLDRLVKLHFDDRWEIEGQDGRKFSIRDPSKLSREEYVSQTDYAVISRVHDPSGHPIFLIAGLGNRATEGAGYFILNRWIELQDRMGTDDFAVVLSFPPPVAPESVEVAACYRV